jgi:imidazolonepropionase-like amidohydrolase
MKERTMKLMREKNTFLVPTISAGEHVAKMASIPGYYPAIIIPKALEVGVQNKASTKKAYQMGVPIAFGTDAGVFPHGDNAGEFVYWEEIGIPPEYSIKSATITNAKLLNMNNLLGQIKKGFYADIIATNDSPTEDISTLKNIIFVMKDGEVYKK